MRQQTGIKQLEKLKTNPYRKADHVNLAGFPSFKPTTEDEYLQVLFTNTLGNTYYASSRDLAEQTHRVHEEMLTKDPEFMAMALVAARNKGYMRLQPIYGLMVLSTKEPGLFQNIFDDIIKTPNDLKQFIWLCRTAGIRQGLGRSCKTAIGNWMSRLSEYHAIKYNQADKTGYSLGDVLRLTKPLPPNKKTEAIWRYVLGKDKIEYSLVQQIDCFESFKIAEPGERADYIKAGKLPHNVLTGVGNLNEEEWKNIVEQMPHMATVMSLRALNNKGLLKDPDVKAMVLDKLTNEETVSRARMLPFRYITAASALSSGHSRMRANPLMHWNTSTPTKQAPEWVYAALDDAMEIAYRNMPVLPGKTLVAVDTSGSMSSPVTGASNMRCEELAGVMGAALFKADPDNVDIIAFTTHPVMPNPFSRRDSIRAIMRAVAHESGGTRLASAIEHAVHNKEKYDFFVGITDSEEWAASDSQHWGHTSYGKWQGFLDAFREYRRKHSPNCQAFLLQLVSASDRVAPTDEPGVHYIYGWSDEVMRYIGQMAEGGGFAGMAESIREGN